MVGVISCFLVNCYYRYLLLLLYDMRLAVRRVLFFETLLEFWIDRAKGLIYCIRSLETFYCSYCLMSCLHT